MASDAVPSSTSKSDQTGPSSSSSPPRVHFANDPAAPSPPDPVANASSSGPPTVSPNHNHSHSHSSASYKQELMDCSVLLDDINDVLAQWESQHSNSQSLQPQSLSSPSSNIALFVPSFASSKTTNHRGHHHHHHRHGQQRSDGLIDIAPSSSTSKRIKPNKPRSVPSLRPSVHLRKSKKTQKRRRSLQSLASGLEVGVEIGVEFERKQFGQRPWRRDIDRTASNVLCSGRCRDQKWPQNAPSKGLGLEGKVEAISWGSPWQWRSA